MRLMSFSVAGRPSFGAAVEGGVVDLGARSRGQYSSAKEVLEKDAIPRMEKLAASASPDFGFEEIVFDLPITDPAKILCVGLNYRTRNEQSAEPPKDYPNVFMRMKSSFVPHRASLIRPSISDQLNYEGEIVLVVGKTGRYLSQEEALGHIAGITIANEGHVTDWCRHARFHTPGRNFDAAGSIGPWIDTDALALGDRLGVRTRLNGQLIQDDTIGSLIWPFAWIVHYFSQFSTLRPGDMFLTGSPAKLVKDDPPRFLRPGDELEFEVAGVGMLANSVADETGK